MKLQQISGTRLRKLKEVFVVGTFQDFATWLQFVAEENAIFCSYCRWFLKDQSAFGSLTGDNGFRLDGIKKQLTSEAHFLVKKIKKMLII